ncbi:MAG: glycosyltransferase [Gomphosphaeria aponina SAG 52.96 = DSM 107014]|uniref:Glycosyltransferase n=1 Tax=Gomphosphaeria aponina SAG 52.96 = DSM 107014 TaxID=1521640 RepID=A0A941GQC7_9CHRO|nr:glycosyltransferase [Gomphosphaeria aponina SAG 52.96 = DSM 107014]
MILTLLLLSLYAIAIYWGKLRSSLRQAPRLTILPHLLAADPKISLIIPAYNEAENIEDCIKAVLASTQLNAEKLEVLVVDDQSTDNTLALAKTFEDPRLTIICGISRPTDKNWVGKNWACTQAAAVATGEFLLFIDADVRLKPKAIETAVNQAEVEKIDLLSLAPAIVCGCLAEWLVQPIMVNCLAVGFDFAQVNDPNTEIAFAAGPFMLFRRAAYEKLGGHAAFAEEVVEDVEMARAIKAAGMKLQLLLGSELMSVRMYRSWGALWEGWTKNIYQGGQRKLGTTLFFALSMVIIYTLPLLCLLGLGSKYLSGNWGRWDYLSLGLGGIALAAHYNLRVMGGKDSHTPPRYWWLSGVGGTVIAAAAITSIIKTETGWGWTWRGRSLSS